MKTVRVGIHSLVLVLVDLIGIGGGALAAYQITGVANQVQWQLPIAIVLSIGFFVAWILFFRVFDLRRMQLVGPKEHRVCWILSILFAPMVFVPLHYFTQGYLTRVGNLVALALYQLPVNALALFVTSVLQNRRTNELA